MRIIEFPDYNIAPDGVITSFRQGGKITLMKWQIMPNGYAVVYLRDLDGNRKTCYVHRLVATAFLRNPRCLPEVNHINSNKLDNSLVNLEWVTSKQNMTHLVESGNHKQAVDVSLTNGNLVVTGKSARHVGKLVGLSLGSVNNLKSGKRTAVNGWSLYVNRSE